MSDGPELLENEPFDEAHAVDAEEDVASTADTPDLREGPNEDFYSGDMTDKDSDRGAGIATPPEEHSDPHEDDYSDDEGGAGPPYDDPDDPRAQRDQDIGPDRHQNNQGSGRSGGDAEDLASQSEDDQSSESSEGQKVEGEYDPADYQDLAVGADIKELFSYITRYQLQVQDLETRLRPFIPDFIPAVGDIDAMIKIKRVDDVDQGLGLEVLDEPCAAQSDPTVLDLQLRSISKTTTSKAVAVKQVTGDPHKTIESWISSISDLHREKPPQTVNYSSQMPDIETLMQAWPPEFEELLQSGVQLPNADINCTLKEYVSIVCGLCDIPIHKEKRIEALHVLFTLFIEFKNSQHFQGMAQGEGEEGPPADIGAGKPDVLNLDDDF